MNSPRDFQLAIADVGLWFIIASRPKLNELRIICTPKPQFRGLVKSFDDVVQIIQERRLGEKV